jgi:hypothetical protein
MPPKILKDSKLMRKTLLKRKSPPNKKREKIPKDITLALNKTLTKSLCESSFITGPKYKNIAKGLSITRKAVTVGIMYYKRGRSYLKIAPKACKMIIFR